MCLSGIGPIAVAIGLSWPAAIPTAEGGFGAGRSSREADDGAPQAVLNPRELKSAIAPWLGTPYRFGRALKAEGTDCSGFSQSVVRSVFMLDLPRSSREQYETGVPVRRAELRPGDLVFFATRSSRVVNHVGVYVGSGVFAHASRGRGVVYDELGRRYFREAYRGARRVRWLSRGA